MSRQKFIMGNWKMNGTKESIHALLQQIKSIQLRNNIHAVVFPPYVYLEKVAWELRNSYLKWGAQNVSEHDDGAYTGEISIHMLKDLGCDYVIIGHSERRQYFHETPELIAKKFLKAAKAGIKTVLCVGETLEEHKSHETKQKILAQVESVLKYEASLEYLPSLIMAYEPVWAIGTGLTATPVEAQEIHQFIREIFSETDEKLALKLPILYGGSVKASNAKELFAMPDIDGALIGGASLMGEEFQAICHMME
jgi:triosephosphate isomerase